jgi:hypothetical protein
MTEQEAKRHARKLLGLYISLFWFVIINIFLYILDYSQNSRIDWAYWVTFGWGIGIASQVFNVYFSSGFEKKMIEKLMKK